LHPPVKKWNEDSVEAKAYKAVEEVPTRELNDRNRLGYYVFLYLDGQYDTLREAIRLSQTRLLVDEDAAYKTVRSKLVELGIEVKE
jgi:hypothetical protein